MELIHFDADLIFNERQVSCARESFSILKKRLHDAQLTLILEPPENEPSEMDDWKAKVHELINRREKLNFPSLRDVLEEQREEADTVSDKMLGCKVRVAPLSRQKSQTQEQVWEKMKRIELNKRLGTDCKAFGARTEGEILRTIENCTSSNSMHPTSRTLRRKSKISGPFTSTSPVPPWIGPGHYEKTEEMIRIEASAASRPNIQKIVPREKRFPVDSNCGSARSRIISRSRRGDDVRNCDQPQDQKDKCSLSIKKTNDKGDGRDVPDVPDIGKSPQSNIRSHDRRGIKYLNKGNDHSDDRRNGMCSNLSSLVAALTKHVGTQSEMKDYTYGALSSLQSYSENDLTEQHASTPHTNLHKRMTVDTWDVRKTSSFTQPFGGDGASSIRVVQSLSIGPTAVQNDLTHDHPKSAKSPMPHSSRSSCIGNEKRESEQNRQHMSKYASSHSDHRTSGVVSTSKDVPNSTADGRDNNYAIMIAAAKNMDVEKNAALSAPVKFPSMETNLTPCIDQWYEDNGLHLPIRRLMLKRPEGFKSPSGDMAKSLIRSNRKAATSSSSSSSPLRAVHSPRSRGMLSTHLDMSGILLPDGAVDRAISSKLFPNARDFDLYIEEHKSRKEGQIT